MPSSSRIGSLRRVLRLRRRETVILRGLMIAATLLVLIGGIAYAFAGATPAWWTRAEQPYDPDAPDPARLATLLENALVTELSRPRPLAPPNTTESQSAPSTNPSRGESEPWSIRITSGELNAWLNAKLPRWLEGPDPSPASDRPATGGRAWPKQVREIRVSLDDGQITLGARVRSGSSGGSERIVWLQARPELHGGELWLLDAHAAIGRMPAPITLLLPTGRGSALVEAGERLRTDAAGFPDTPALKSALLGEAPVIKDASVRLHDGRRVRLVGLTVEDGSLVLAWVTTAPR